MFAPDAFSQYSLSYALKYFLGFAAVFTGVCFGIVYMFPGKIAVPRSYPYNGLIKELGFNQPARAESSTETALQSNSGE